jgi:uncharacterized RDD family membrane protein YckC
MTEQKISSGTRIGSMILDHFAMTVIIMLFFIPVMVINFATAFSTTHEQPNPDMFGGMKYLMLFGFSIYLCKDCINGRSIAKRILKLQVVDNLTGQAASPIKCFIRNIFCILWPLEVIVALVNTSRRVGDRVAGTKLVVFDKSVEEKMKFGKVLIPVILAYGLMLLISLPFESLESGMDQQRINYVETSFNEQASKETVKLFSDSLGQYMTADVRVYDKVEKSNAKYISVILYLKENYHEGDKPITETIPLLHTKFPEKTFVGQIQYVYKSPFQMETRTIRLIN